MYIKNFENYIINEGIEDAGANVINKAFMSRPPIDMGNGEIVERKKIVKTVRDAITFLSFDWGSFFKFVSNFTIVYILDCPGCQTMCVDDKMNIWIDARFIWVDLKHDPKLVGAVLMHEIFHVVYNHIERGQRWVVSQNKQMTPETNHDTNLAADVEVNVSLVRKGIIKKDTLKNEIRGLYLDKLENNVPPMESILEDEKLMNELRKMHPFKNNTQEKNNKENEITTTSDFDDGYVEMKNKITDLVNKYGPEKTIEKLREIGAVEGINPKPSKDLNPDDVFALNFLTIKSFDEFINESNSNGYSTKMDGYKAAIEKAMQEIMSAINGGGVSDDEKNNNSPNIKSNIDQSKLKPMNLPKKENSNDNNSKSGSDSGLPSNVNQDSSGKQDSKNSQDGQKGPGGQDSQAGQDGQDSQDGQKGPSGQDSQDGQAGNKGDSGNNAFSNTKKIKGTIDISYDGKKDGIGKTGTFINSEESDKLSDSLKKTYGEHTEKVLNQLEKNSIINTKEKLEQKRKELYNSLGSNDIIKQIWDEAKKSESKFKAMWKKMLKRFLSKATRNAGKDVKNMNDTRWFERRHMTIKTMASYHPTIGNDVQDINVYIDVSGSVSSAELLLQLIAQSLVTFLKTYNYSGINIIPWASESTGIHKVESIKSGSSQKAIDEILKHINDGIGQCGGGTNLNACLNEIVETTFQYKNRKQKDDVHIIISDGETFGDENGVENKIMKKVMEKGGNSSLAKKVVKNCIWMIYDNNGTSWDNAIQDGELVKISSKNVIPD